MHRQANLTAPLSVPLLFKSAQASFCGKNGQGTYEPGRGPHVNRPLFAPFKDCIGKRLEVFVKPMEDTFATSSLVRASSIM